MRWERWNLPECHVTKDVLQQVYVRDGMARVYRWCLVWGLHGGPDQQAPALWGLQTDVLWERCCGGVACLSQANRAWRCAHYLVKMQAEAGPVALRSVGRGLWCAHDHHWYVARWVFLPPPELGERARIFLQTGREWYREPHEVAATPRDTAPGDHAPFACNVCSNLWSVRVVSFLSAPGPISGPGHNLEHFREVFLTSESCSRHERQPRCAAGNE